MSLAELKDRVGALPENERRELAAYLLQIGRERNQTWQNETSRRTGDTDDGKKVTQADFKRRVSLGQN